jgi:hypothetical protein
MMPDRHVTALKRHAKGRILHASGLHFAIVCLDRTPFPADSDPAIAGCESKKGVTEQEGVPTGGLNCPTRPGPGERPVVIAACRAGQAYGPWRQRP